MAKHVVTIRARLVHHGDSVSTHFTISQKMPYYPVVKRRKNGDFNIIVYQMTSSLAKRKHPPSLSRQNYYSADAAQDL